TNQKQHLLSTTGTTKPNTKLQYDNTINTSLEQLSNLSKALLASPIVPNLKLNRPAVDGNHSSPKFNSDCEIMHRLEPLVGELKKQTRFSHTYRKRLRIAKGQMVQEGGDSVTCVADDYVLE
ncbi:lipid-transfer protein, partial [Striga asiatica]